MTNATMALADLAEKGPDVDMLRQMVQFMAQRMMDFDVESLCGAGYDEKSTERLNSRNGFRDLASWSPGVRPRKPWLPSSRRPTCTACPRARWTSWSRPWA
jgi:hypothetical protein